jgi:hypothetical protein
MQTTFDKRIPAYVLAAPLEQSQQRQGTRYSFPFILPSANAAACRCGCYDQIGACLLLSRIF